MAVRNWRAFLVKLVLGNTEKPWWGRFLVSVGLVSDFLSEGMSQGLRSGWVHREDLPADSLEIVGRARGLIQYPGETNQQYQARLARAWTDWTFAGHETSIEGQLAAAGFPGATVVYHTTREGPRGEPAPYWSQFWIEIPLATLEARPGWTASPQWGSCVWGYFWWGTGALSVSDARLIQAIVRKFKANDHYFRGIEIG